MIDLAFVSMLNELLEQCPGSIDCLARTEAHNHAVGGAPHSGHVVEPCVAADLVFDSPAALIAAARCALALGFMGVELDLSNHHLHVDELPRTWRVVHWGHGQDTALEAYLAMHL